jgi:YD repeat-containing protein
VDVRWTEIRVVHSADTDEPDGGTGLRVVAPDRNPAGRAAGDLLTLAARRQRYDDFGLTGGVHDTIGLIERVESMRGPGLPLAPTAMASMNDQWRSNQTISGRSDCCRRPFTKALWVETVVRANRFQGKANSEAITRTRTPSPPYRQPSRTEHCY